MLICSKLPGEVASTEWNWSRWNLARPFGINTLNTAKKLGKALC